MTGQRSEHRALDDERIERYSRQLILAEIGPRGQERLLAARVAIVGAGTAAARVVAHLAAAGVGWIACAPELHGAVDPDTRDVTLGTLVDAARDGVDAAVVVAATSNDAAAAITAWRTRTPATLWIAAGRAGGTPSCPRCAAGPAAEDTAAPTELAALRDVVLATIVATEVVKLLVAVGTTLAGRVIAYDPDTAAVEVLAVDRDCRH